MLAWWLNTAWMLKCTAERALFARACRRVRQTQAELLGQMLHENRDTWFGRRHGFAKIVDVSAFRDRVPPTTYDDYAPLVARIAAGEAGVLTRDSVLLFEPTSGTIGGEKLIPYTAGLRRQFQRGIAVWIADLFYHRPAVRAGRAYWSISPALGPPRRASGGLPIGFDEDTAYLGRLEQLALRKLLVTPDKHTQSDMTAFREATVRSLMAAKDLTLISVWSPTFLTVLLSQPSLAHASGSEVWPNLALISCWTDAAAGQFVPELRRLFPGVEIQPKGLLATEGFVSIPLVDKPGAALAVRSHFFEFEEETGRIRLAHELEQGGRYRVLITTAGGLYRYQLRDEIGIVGFHQQCPLLRFLGKSDLISDLVGEKLAETHVRMVLDGMASLPPGFRLLVPVLGRPPRYRLYIQAKPGSEWVRQKMMHELQAGLEENPYYRHAVALGQLAPVEIAPLRSDGENAWPIFERRCLERGQKAGDIKPAALDRWTGWPERFASLLAHE